MSPNGFISSRISPILSEDHTPVDCIGFSISDTNHESSDSQIAFVKNTTQLLINAWGRHRLILKSREAEKNLVNTNRILSQQTFHDALTGLPIDTYLIIVYYKNLTAPNVITPVFAY
jgi:hypothetical protein